MLVYERRANDTLVRFKKAPLGVIEKRDKLWVYIPRACDRQVVWEFKSLMELKKFLQGGSEIHLTA